MITFDDQVTQLSQSFTFKQDADRLGSLAKKAVGNAYVDISAKSQWNYLKRRTLININGCYSTGTIQYTASTRTLTLTGGTFPANSVSCDVMLNRNIYAVQTRTDDTHLVLLTNRCPVADIDAGTQYAIVQTTYILPTDFVEVLGITETERFWWLQQWSPEDMLANSQLWFTPTNPCFFTILGAGGAGRMYAQFSPPPGSDRTYHMIYQARPRPRTLTAMYATGKVATTAGSRTVTLTGGTFPVGLTSGNVLRIGSANTVPTGLYGANPYVEEHLIASRTDATHVELQDEALYTTTSAAYSVDDPIDLEELSMQTYFDRLCEARLLRLHQAASDKIADAENAAERAKFEAKAADSRFKPGANIANNLPIGEAFFWGARVGPPS